MVGGGCWLSRRAARPGRGGQRQPIREGSPARTRKLSVRTPCVKTVETCHPVVWQIGKACRNGTDCDVVVFSILIGV